MKQKWLKPPDPTGWNEGLSQDYSKELSDWFSSRLTAREDVRRAFPSQFNNLQEPRWSGIYLSTEGFLPHS